MKKMLIALITNNQTNRLANANKIVDVIANSLLNKLIVTSIVISEEPEVELYSLPRVIIKEIRHKYLEYEWGRYREKKQSILLCCQSLLKTVLVKYIFGSKDKRINSLRRSVIDDYITAQHLRAWEMFIESGMDYLLILEDDVYLNDQSVYLFNHRIVKTIFLIETQHINSGLFVDCAGGFSLDELQTDNLEIKHEEMLRWYYKPVTNTACAYIINRIIAKKFFFIMIRNPWLRLIPVDWLMNKLFLLMGEDAKRCICFHADPPVFIHGSAAGIYSARP